MTKTCKGKPNLHELDDKHLYVVEEVVSSWPAGLQKTAILFVSSQEDTKTWRIPEVDMEVEITKEYVTNWQKNA